MHIESAQGEVTTCSRCMRKVHLPTKLLAKLELKLEASLAIPLMPSHPWMHIRTDSR